MLVLLKKCGDSVSVTGRSLAGDCKKRHLTIEEPFECRSILTVQS